MKTLNLNIQIIFAYMYAMLHAIEQWSEKQWKETISPPISMLFAEAINDMKQGKPLPELPEMPEEIPKNLKEPELMSTKHASLLIFSPLLLVLCYMFITEHIMPLPMFLWLFIGCTMVVCLSYLMFHVTRYHFWQAPRRDAEVKRILTNLNSRSNENSEH